jgi:IcmF-related N-terminal domain
MAMTTSLLELPGPATESTTAPRPSVLSRAEEVETLDDRLRHLCSLIVRDRRPFCPVNGILALIPYTATDDDTRARQVGTVCHLDLTAARTSLGISCPVFSLLCDMENAKCFDHLIRFYASEPGYRQIGRSFPLVPDMDIPERVQMIEMGMEWICQSLIAPMVYRLFQLESVAGDEGGKRLESNAELIQFLADTHERWRRLGRLLGRVISLDPQGDLMLGGCYLAATGETDSEQGFVTGVMRTLLENQNFVAWTPEMLRRDRADSQSATLYNLGFLGVTAFAAVAAYLFWFRNR